MHADDKHLTRSEAQLPICTEFFGGALLTSKVGYTELVSGVQQVFISRSVHTLDYKSQCAAVTICATMVDPEFDFYIFTYDLEK